MATRDRGGVDEDAAAVDALRRGDEAAFLRLVRRDHGLMLRIARGYVRDARAAEDVVQETWLAVLEGIDRFEGRSALRTWIFRILVNRAITRAQRDRRQVPFSALAGDEGDEGPTVDPSRFRSPSDSQFPGHWASAPRRWEGLPVERLLARETMDVVRRAIDALPGRQRAVILLRDVGGFASGEVCAALELTEGNQRVLLHRARAKVREALERELGEDG